MKQITKVGVVVALALVFNATAHVAGLKAEVSGIPEIKRIEKRQQIKQVNVEPIAKAEPVAIPKPKPVIPQGNCMAWINAAGINDIDSALKLIARESGCNPYAVNPSSGACGVGQALPCSKTGCEMGDGYCQVRWMHQYVIGRYGTWANALAHSYAHNWY